MAAVPDVGRATRVESRVAPEATATQDLYERYSAQLLGYCFHKLGSREEAEDAVQQTFLNAFRGLKRGIVPEAESAWLFKIAENVCLTRRRSSFRRGRVETPGDIQALQEYVAAPQRMGTDELIQLQKALVGMPATQRKAILLREWQGLSYREIADEMGLTQPAVETLIFRARRSLAEGLERPEERTTLLARLRSAFDLASIAGGLKAVLAGSVAAKAVATTAAAVTVAGAVVAAAPEHRSEEAPRAALERASAAKASAPGTTVSALARARADARRDAAAHASRDDSRPREPSADDFRLQHDGPRSRHVGPRSGDGSRRVRGRASRAPGSRDAGVAARERRSRARRRRRRGRQERAPQAKGRGKPAADGPTPAAAPRVTPETAKAKAPDARPEPPEQPAPASPPELPAAAEANRPEQSEAKVENANPKAQPEAPAEAKGKP